MQTFTKIAEKWDCICQKKASVMLMIYHQNKKNIYLFKSNFSQSKGVFMLIVSAKFK